MGVLKLNLALSCWAQLLLMLVGANGEQGSLPSVKSRLIRRSVARHQTLPVAFERSPTGKSSPRKTATKKKQIMRLSVESKGVTTSLDGMRGTAHMRMFMRESKNASIDQEPIDRGEVLSYGKLLQSVEAHGVARGSTIQRLRSLSRGLVGATSGALVLAIALPALVLIVIVVAFVLRSASRVADEAVAVDGNTSSPKKRFQLPGMRSKNAATESDVLNSGSATSQAAGSSTGENQASAASKMAPIPKFRTGGKKNLPCGDPVIPVGIVGDERQIAGFASETRMQEAAGASTQAAASADQQQEDQKQQVREQYIADAKSQSYDINQAAPPADQQQEDETKQVREQQYMEDAKRLSFDINQDGPEVFDLTEQEGEERRAREAFEREAEAARVREEVEEDARLEREALEAVSEAATDTLQDEFAAATKIKRLLSMESEIEAARVLAVEAVGTMASEGALDELADVLQHHGLAARNIQSLLNAEQEMESLREQALEKVAQALDENAALEPADSERRASELSALPAELDSRKKSWSSVSRASVNFFSGLGDHEAMPQVRPSTKHVQKPKAEPGLSTKGASVARASGLDFMRSADGSREVINSLSVNRVQRASLRPSREPSPSEGSASGVGGAQNSLSVNRVQRASLRPSREPSPSEGSASGGASAAPSTSPSVGSNFFDLMSSSTATLGSSRSKRDRAKKRDQ